MAFNTMTTAGWSRLALSVIACAGSGVALAQADMKGEMLRVQNGFRAQVGVAPLVWDDLLADEAREYAEELARTNKFEHADAAESLWYGPIDTPPDKIAAAWAVSGDPNVKGEKDKFVNARFTFNGRTDAVSTTGNWFDIGHYSQMVWQGTSRVGCATAIYADGKRKVGICRYSPAGNFDGQFAYGPQSTPATIGSTLEDKVLKHFNAARYKNKMGGLTWDATLASQANNELNARLGGSTSRPAYNELVDTAGYAAGGGGAAPPSAPSPRSMIVRWVDVDPYRGGILNPANTKVGCATGSKVSGSANNRVLVCRLAGA